MTRIRYTYNQETGGLNTDWIPVSSNLVIKAHILQTTDNRYYYRIVTSDIDMLYEGYCISLRMAKINVRGRFKELGVNLYEEVRKATI